MKMTWHDLLFAHWAIDANVLRPLVPDCFPIDTFNGTAWIAIVAFRMTGVKAAFLPPVPGTSAFPELNVRTYVTMNDRPGVYFLSLDAASKLAVRGARSLFHLPYFDAEMSCEERQGVTFYKSKRTHRDANLAEFTARYAPIGDVFRAQPGSLESFLVDRFAFYTTDAKEQVYRCDIAHDPWPLQPADAKIETNTMARAHGIDLPRARPLCHFSKRLDVVAESLIKIE
jgi:uncharacterized protein YqjF (DUF2071 family)